MPAAAVVAAASLTLAGCGGPASTSTDGKTIFSDAGCGSCHSLDAAGSDGGSGPDLTNLKVSADVVAEQVTNGGGGMPSFKGRLTDEQIQAVAKFVAANDGS
ncbi:MAG: cytochrome c [Solirubrobacterales bacterium]